VVLRDEGFCAGRLVLRRRLASCQTRGYGKRRAVMAREACWRARETSVRGGWRSVWGLTDVRDEVVQGSILWVGNLRATAAGVSAADSALAVPGEAAAVVAVASAELAASAAVGAAVAAVVVAADDVTAAAPMAAAVAATAAVAAFAKLCSCVGVRLFRLTNYSD
jgi:hypothetical protein